MTDVVNRAETSLPRSQHFHVPCPDTRTVPRFTIMDETFQETAGFQDSHFFQKAIEINESKHKKTVNVVEMHFECDISPFRIQTLT